jgi:hypothetical protein
MVVFGWFAALLASGYRYGGQQSRPNGFSYSPVSTSRVGVGLYPLLIPAKASFLVFTLIFVSILVPVPGFVVRGCTRVTIAVSLVYLIVAVLAARTASVLSPSIYPELCKRLNFSAFRTAFRFLLHGGDSFTWQKISALLPVAEVAKPRSSKKGGHGQHIPFLTSMQQLHGLAGLIIPRVGLILKCKNRCFLGRPPEEN